MEPFVLKERANHPPLFYIDKWMKRYPGLNAGFSSRLGGASEGHFSSLNCGLHVGDVPGHVISNREKVSQAAGFSFDAWTCAEQVHGSDVAVVTIAERGRGRESRVNALQARDALITTERDVMLAAFFADCVPLYFYDPARNAVGLAHAGWKGTVLEIAEKTVIAMSERFGSSPSEIVAAIGPSIGMCCYEVDETVMEKVRGNEFLRESKAYEQKRDGKYMLNLQEMNRQIMIKAGILPTNIELTHLCTSCRSDLFFSHRKEKGKTGRMVGWIGLEKR